MSTATKELNLQIGDEQVDPSRIRPLPGRIFVHRVLKAEKTASGIFLPDQTRAISMLGRAMAVGAGVAVEPGDLVIFSVFAARPCTTPDPTDDQWLFVREDDVFATVSQGAADSGNE